MFWDKFVSLCNEKGKSPTVALEEIGLTAAVGTQWSNGAQPRKTNVYQVAKYFNVDPQELTDTEADTPFYKNLCRISAERNESVRSIALKAGLSNAAPTNWAKGKMPTDATIAKIAAYLGTTSEDLLSENSQPKQKEKPTAQGDGLISDLPQDIQDLIALCKENPQFASALINLAQQIQNRSSGQA